MLFEAEYRIGGAVNQNQWSNIGRLALEMTHIAMNIDDMY